MTITNGDAGDVKLHTPILIDMNTDLNVTQSGTGTNTANKTYTINASLIPAEADYIEVVYVGRFFANADSNTASSITQSTALVSILIEDTINSTTLLSTINVVNAVGPANIGNNRKDSTIDNSFIVFISITSDMRTNGIGLKTTFTATTVQPTDHSASASFTNRGIKALFYTTLT